MVLIISFIMQSGSMPKIASADTHTTQVAIVSVFCTVITKEMIEATPYIYVVRCD